MIGIKYKVIVVLVFLTISFFYMKTFFVKVSRPNNIMMVIYSQMFNIISIIILKCYLRDIKVVITNICICVMCSIIVVYTLQYSFTDFFFNYN